MLPPTPVPADLPPPSENELRLGRKVLDLEKERDTLAAELRAVKTRFPAHSNTIPLPSSPSHSQPLFTIPHELLPTLSLLQNHITELTRDNEALRYTFLDGNNVASSSKVKLDTPSTPLPAGVQGLDLNVVLDRVRELIRENEELGEMILEAGRGSAIEWQNALEESKAVITSLDSDLAHHLTVVQSLRSELVAYKTHFGPLPSKEKAVKKDGDSASSTTSRDKPKDLIGSNDRDKERERGLERDRNQDRNRSSQSGRSDKRVDKPASSTGGIERDRDRDRRRDDPRRDGYRPNGTSSGGGRKEEDREYKRRR